MTIVILTLIVVFSLCGAAVLTMLAHWACTHAMEPELLVIDEPHEDAAAGAAEEAHELRAAGEPA